MQSEEKRMKKTEDNTPANLTHYQIALALVDRLQAEGFLQDGDREKIYSIVAEKYCIDKNGIFAP